MVGGGARAYQQYTQSFPLITTAGVRRVIDKIFSRTIRSEAKSPEFIGNPGRHGSGSGVATQGSASASSNSYRPATAYGFSANSEVTADNADAVVKFISQFLR
jgi:hypothetical protein